MEIKRRIDRYTVGCNEDIVPDCRDEPRLLLRRRRNAPKSLEMHVSIIAGHKFWGETEIKRSWKQTAWVTIPYLYLFKEIDDQNPDHLVDPEHEETDYCLSPDAFCDALLHAIIIQVGLTLKWIFHITSHFYTSRHCVHTISQAAGSCLKSECVSSTDTLFL